MVFRMPSRRTCVMLLCALALGTGTFQLGQWQSRRAVEKQALEDRRAAALSQDVLTLSDGNLPDPESFRFRKVRLQGHFIPGAWVALDNRQINGRPAVSIIQAFKAQPHGFVVAIDRGLLPRDPAAPRQTPVFQEQDADVTIEGFLQVRFARTAELWGIRVADDSRIHRNGREWSNFSTGDFEREFAQPLQEMRLGNYVVVQADADSDGFYRVQPQWTSEVGKHRGYAFQWYSLTALLAVMVAILLWRDRRGISPQ